MNSYNIKFNFIVAKLTTYWPAFNKKIRLTLIRFTCNPIEVKVEKIFSEFYCFNFSYKLSFKKLLFITLMHIKSRSVLQKSGI